MFQVNTDGLRSASYPINDGRYQLNRNYYEIEDVKGLLSGLSGMWKVIGTLNALQENVRMEAGQEEALYNTIQMIAKKYTDCEEEIIDNMDNGKFGFGVSSPRTALFRLDRSRTTKIDEKVLKELLALFS